MSILEVFCDVDNFCQEHWKQPLLEERIQHAGRKSEMAPSEIMTLMILFHQSCYRTFKHYYLNYVNIFLRQEFPHLVRYARFVEVMEEYLVPLTAYLHTKMGTCTGISFSDSTPLAICKNPRIPSHRIFADLAQSGKSSTCSPMWRWLDIIFPFVSDSFSMTSLLIRKPT